MSAFVRNLTFVLAALSVAAGVFAGLLLPIFEVQISSLTEFRWWLIVGMPVVLLLAYAWLNQQPAKTMFAAVLQAIGLHALFLAPYWWVVRHAK